MYIYDRKISYCHFNNIEQVDELLLGFVKKQFAGYLKKVSSRYQDKHCAAIIFVLCNLWEELAHIPAEYGGYDFWEEAELSPFIAPTRTTQGGCTFSCAGVAFSSAVLWKALEKSALSNLYVIHRGRFQNKKRSPSRLIPRWTSIKVLKDEYERYSNKSYNYKSSSSSSNNTIFTKILSTELIEIKQRRVPEDRRRKGTLVTLPIAEFLDNDVVTSSAEFLGQLRTYTRSISLSLDNLSDVTSDRSSEAELEFSNSEMGKKVAPCFHSFVMGNEISKKNFELSKFEGQPFPLKRCFHLLKNGSFSWGRIYGFPSDFLTRWQKLLLKIDGKPTVQIDIKSCIPQIACMKFSPDDDNTQDFYSFPSLMKYGIDRDYIKSIFMSLCNSKSIKKWIANQKFHNMENKLLSPCNYSDIINEIITNKPFFKNIIANPEMYKMLIKEESDFMISCMKSIMDYNIKFLYNYDCFIIQDDEDQINSVLEIMRNQSLYKWGKYINVDIDRYFLTHEDYINDDEALVMNF